MTALPPVLLVHGIWNTGAAFARLARELQRRERLLDAIDLLPNDGSVALEQLAMQLEPAVRRLLQASDAAKIDVVGFSMGALVTRYWLQQLGGKHLTRRYVSISGPHAGTRLAQFSKHPGIAQMRPGNPWLQNLAQDPSPFGSVEVHTLRTPFDLMIVPSSSCGSLPNCKSQTTLPVLLHRWMLTDPRAISRVAAILDAP